MHSVAMRHVLKGRVGVQPTFGEPAADHLRVERDRESTTETVKRAGESMRHASENVSPRVRQAIDTVQERLGEWQQGPAWKRQATFVTVLFAARLFQHRVEDVSDRAVDVVRERAQAYADLVRGDACTTRVVHRVEQVVHKTPDGRARRVRRGHRGRAVRSCPVEPSRARERADPGKHHGDRQAGG